MCPSFFYFFLFIFCWSAFKISCQIQWSNRICIQTEHIYSKLLDYDFIQHPFIGYAPEFHIFYIIGPIWLSLIPEAVSDGGNVRADNQLSTLKHLSTKLNSNAVNHYKESNIFFQILTNVSLDFLKIITKFYSETRKQIPTKISPKSWPKIPHNSNVSEIISPQILIQELGHII